MNWDAIGAIGQMLGSVAVFVTLAYLARQMSLNTRQLRRAEQNTTQADFSALRLAVAQNGELAQLVFTARTDFASLDPVSRYRVEQYFLEQTFVFYNIWDRVQKGDVDVKWEEVERGPTLILQTDYGRELWQRFRLGLPPGFRAVMDRLAAIPPAPER